MEDIRELINCPLCERDLAVKPSVTDKDTALIDCNSCGTFEITEDCLIFSDVYARFKQRIPKLIEWVKAKNLEGIRWPVIHTKMV